MERNLDLDLIPAIVDLRLHPKAVADPEVNLHLLPHRVARLPLAFLLAAPLVNPEVALVV